MPAKINLIGKTFGRLTVVSQSENIKTPNGRSHVAWLCKCECGQEIIVRSDNLRNGHTVSCGCKQKENLINGGKSRLNDLTGQRFGKLTVIERAKYNTGSGDAVWKCKCDCGNFTDVIGNNLTRKKEGTVSCGCLHSRGEEKISQILIKMKIPFEYQKSFNSCIFPDSGSLAKFDFYIDNFLLLEYDGIQHFEYKNSGWNNLEQFQRLQKRDAYKNQWCEENNIKLVRIPYTDFDKLDESYIHQLMSHYGYGRFEA